MPHLAALLVILAAAEQIILPLVLLFAGFLIWIGFSAVIHVLAGL